MQHHSSLIAEPGSSPFLPPRQLGGEKRESRRGGVTFIEENDLRAKQGQTDALAVKAVCLSEYSLSMGMAQTSSRHVKLSAIQNHQ